MAKSDPGITTQRATAAFVARVGIALRYGPSKSLPLASMCEAVRREREPERDAERRATVLTNALIEAGAIAEVNAIAERVCVVDASLLAPLIALCRRGRSVDELELSDTARRVLAFVADEPRPTAGMVRSFLRVPPKTWPNAADDALAELQRALVLDRGATEVPKTGAPYLGKDGIPYRLVDREHAAHVRRAKKLSVAAAADALLGAYLATAGDVPPRKLASMFSACVSRDELDASLARLA